MKLLAYDLVSNINKISKIRFFFKKVLTFKIKVCIITAHKLCAGIAQLVEHLICNQAVGGSSPFASSILLQCLTRIVCCGNMVSYSSGQRGQTVNLLVFTFGGSNPPLTTTSFCGNSSVG